jgi:hypothetical protein
VNRRQQIIIRVWDAVGNFFEDVGNLFRKRAR